MVCRGRTTSPPEPRHLFTSAQLAIIAKYLHAYPHLAIPFHNAKVSQGAARQFAADLALLPTPLAVSTAEAFEISRLKLALDRRRTRRLSTA